MNTRLNRGTFITRRLERMAPTAPEPRLAWLCAVALASISGVVTVSLVTILVIVMTALAGLYWLTIGGTLLALLALAILGVIADWAVNLLDLELQHRRRPA